MALDRDEAWCDESGLSRRWQACGACRAENVLTGPAAYLAVQGARFAVSHAACTGVNPALVGMTERRAAYAAKKAAEKAAERALAAGTPTEEPAPQPEGPRQQAFAAVFGRPGC